jgi:hypothetical protein
MHPTKFRFICQSGFRGDNLQKIENYCQKHILKSGKKPVATKLYGNDTYMIHFQIFFLMNFFTNFLFIVMMVVIFDGGWGPQPYFWKNITWLKTSGCHPTWLSLLQKIENYCQKHILKSGKKPVGVLNHIFERILHICIKFNCNIF